MLHLRHNYRDCMEVFMVKTTLQIKEIYSGKKNLLEILLSDFLLKNTLANNDFSTMVSSSMRGVSYVK